MASVFCPPLPIFFIRHSLPISLSMSSSSTPLSTVENVDPNESHCSLKLFLRKQGGGRSSGKIVVDYPYAIKKAYMKKIHTEPRITIAETPSGGDIIDIDIVLRAAGKIVPVIPTTEATITETCGAANSKQRATPQELHFRPVAPPRSYRRCLLKDLENIPFVECKKKNDEDTDSTDYDEADSTEK